MIFIKRAFFILFFLFGFCSLALSQQSFALIASEAASGFKNPVIARFPPGRTLKFLVFESAGKIFWVDKDTKLSSPLYDLAQNGRSIKIVDAMFHPDYEKNGRLFIGFIEMFTESTDYVVQEYSPSEITGESPSLVLYKEILRIKSTNNKEKAKKEKEFSLALDSSENLLIALPDGAEDFDPTGQAQDYESLWGKVLRLNIKEAEYLAPLDNPFAMEKTGKKEIYATGFREPADMFFDSKENIIWITDRGADTFQELNLLKPGANYGWSVFEGSLCLRMQMECRISRIVNPFFEYPLKLGKKIVISPPYFGKKSPQAEGFLFVHDLDSGTTWAVKRNAESKLDKKEVVLTDLKLRFDNFAVDGLGEIYAINSSQGVVFSLQIIPSVN